MHALKTIRLGLAVAAFCSLVAGAADVVPLPKTMLLWSGKSSTASEEAQEKVLPDRGDGVRRITDIKAPSLTVYHAKGAGVKPAALVFPGGGYGILAINKEGTEVAEWLSNKGVTAIVVKYTVPKDREAAFRDAQRAIRMVRHHAGPWGIDPERVGVLGFSAGGHLAARLSSDYTAAAYAAEDEVDTQPCRPDFCVLVYPAYLLNTKTKGVATELPLSSQTPPTFMVQTDDDKRHVVGTIAYDKALKQLKVPSIFHRFPTGGHGYGLRPSKSPVSKWPALCEAWMKQLGVIATSR